MNPTLIALLIVGILAGCSKAVEEMDVVGSYERREGDIAYSLVFRGNGVVEEYENGRVTMEAKWAIKGGELELIFILNGNKNFYSVGSDSSLTLVAVEILGKRKEAWEGKEITFKKVR